MVSSLIRSQDLGIIFHVSLICFLGSRFYLLSHSSSFKRKRAHCDIVIYTKNYILCLCSSFRATTTLGISEVVREMKVDFVILIR